MTTKTQTKTNAKAKPASKELEYTADDVIECLNAADKVGDSMQRIINQLVKRKALNVVLQGLNKLRDTLKSGPELNSKLDIMRMQIKRACQTHELPPVGIKWDKDASSYVFAATKPKQPTPKDAFKQKVAQFIASGPSDDEKDMVVQLMDSIMKARTEEAA